MDLDALFRMPMTRRSGDGGVRPFACAASVGALRMGSKPGAILAAGR
ncbi:MAG: hypothetical protein ACRYF6_17330 [Janthinobacterium lividum]